MQDAPGALRLNDKALRHNRMALAALPPSRAGRHHLDLARAWFWQADRARSLYELETAEKIAPQLIRSHPRTPPGTNQDFTPYRSPTMIINRDLGQRLLAQVRSLTF